MHMGQVGWMEGAVQMLVLIIKKLGSCIGLVEGVKSERMCAPCHYLCTSSKQQLGPHTHSRWASGQVYEYMYILFLYMYICMYGYIHIGFGCRKIISEFMQRIHKKQFT
jgi:hypothetical protein